MWNFGNVYMNAFYLSRWIAKNCFVTRKPNWKFKISLEVTKHHGWRVLQKSPRIHHHLDRYLRVPRKNIDTVKSIIQLSSINDNSTATRGSLHDSTIRSSDNLMSEYRGSFDLKAQADHIMDDTRVHLAAIGVFIFCLLNVLWCDCVCLDLLFIY